MAAASYLLLTLYDVLALRHIRRTLPYRQLALASFTGYAFSHALGFGSLIGPSVRYRIYTPLALSVGEPNLILNQDDSDDIISYMLSLKPDR